MKKGRLILTVIALSITIFSCNEKNTKQENTAVTEKSLTQEKELIVSLTIEGEKIKLKEADISNNAMTPGQKSNDYTINATPEGDDDNTDLVALSLDFTTTGHGEEHIHT